MNEDIEALMQEPAGGYNHGRRLSDNPNVEGRDTPLDTEDWQAAEFMRGGGWSIVDTHSRAGEAGMTAHRGVLHPDEYVDTDTLRALVEERLGFTYEQIHGVYRQGPLSNEQRELRAKIDARLLALSRAGGTMIHLARSFGWTVRGDASDGQRCDTMERAVERARAAE